MQRYTVYCIWKLLYMFRVVPPPIIRSGNNCIYSIWYLSLTVWQISAAVDTIVSAPDDWWWYHPKHVEQFPDTINSVTYLVGYILEYRVTGMIGSLVLTKLRFPHTKEFIRKLSAVCALDLKKGSPALFWVEKSLKNLCFNPLAYTNVPETAGLARSINTQPAVRRNSETNPTSQHNRGMYWSQ